MTLYEELVAIRNQLNSLVLRAEPVWNQPPQVEPPLPPTGGAGQVIKVPSGGSIAAAFAQLRDGYPDQLLLERGGVYEESVPFLRLSGRSIEEPMVIGAYGEGPRPVLRTGVMSGIQGIAAIGEPRGFLRIADLSIDAHTYDGTNGNPQGIFLGNSWHDLTIENIEIIGGAMGIVMQAIDPGQRLSNVLIRRCVIADGYGDGGRGSGGVFMSDIDGLTIEDCVFDHNGWKEGVQGMEASEFRQALYLHQNCTDVVTLNNIVARSASTGISQRGGGDCMNNLCLQNPIGIGFGHAQAGSIFGTVWGNVVLDSRDIQSAAGLQQRGWGIIVTKPNGVAVDNNVVAYQRTGTGNAFGICIDFGFTTVKIGDNTVFAWGTQGWSGTPALRFNGAGGIATVRGNSFQQVEGGIPIEYQQPLSCFAFGGNNYWNPTGEVAAGQTYKAWTEIEPGATFDKRDDPHRTIEDYMAHIGVAGGLTEFMALARAQDPRATAGAVNAWVREGFAASTGAVEK